MHAIHSRACMRTRTAIWCLRDSYGICHYHWHSKLAAARFALTLRPHAGDLQKTRPRSFVHWCACTVGAPIVNNPCATHTHTHTGSIHVAWPEQEEQAKKHMPTHTSAPSPGVCCSITTRSSSSSTRSRRVLLHRRGRTQRR